MSRNVTIRLSDSTYHAFRSLAEQNNTSVSGFIRSIAVEYVEEYGLLDRDEMEEFDSDKELNRSLHRAYDDAKNMRGRFV
jgi:predicted transcriptional regulator